MFQQSKVNCQADDYEWDDGLVLLSTLTSSCRRTNDFMTPRLPIKRNLLETLLFEIGRHFNTLYTILLYQAVFVLLYYGLLRIGEATISEHVIKAKDVHVDARKRKLLFILYSSKTHKKGARPQKIKISARTCTSKYKFFCPFVLLHNYSQIRGGYDDDSEQFFIHRDGSPLNSHQVRRVLRKLLKNLNLNPKYYGTHSFRIGQSLRFEKGWQKY